MSATLSGIIGKIRQHRGIIANFSYLTVIQMISLLVTLATYPYLIRVLGKDQFGLVVYAQAIVTYLVILVSYGFQISATREVSVHRNEPEQVNQIFSSVLILKGMLFLFSFGILFLVFAIFPAVREHRILFCLSMFTCFYEFIFPSWFFQGIEKMGYITIITIITKSTFFILIFVFIRTSEDYLLVPLFSGIGSVLAGIISLWIAFSREKIRFSFQPVHRLWYHLRESSALFASNIANQVYVNSNKVIVGIFLGMSEVALYDLAEKVVLAMKLPQYLLNQAIFPKVSKELNAGFTKKVLYISIVGQIGFYAVIALLAPVIVLILGGKGMMDSISLLRLLALTVPINAISSLLGIQFLVAHGFKRVYTRVVVSSVVVYTAACCLLYILNWVTLPGVIGATIVAEIFVLLAMIGAVVRRSGGDKERLGGEEVRRLGSERRL